jgi:hypothetical protein
MKHILLRAGTLMMAVMSITAFTLLPLQASAQGASGRYVAMGDSVSAGAGLAGSKADKACGRSAEAYPNIVADELGYQLQQLSCGGAKVDEGIYGKQRVRGPDPAPQLDAAFAGGEPQLISMTIGANDVRWSRQVRSCISGRCDSKWDSRKMQVYLFDLRLELDHAMSEIQRRSTGTPPTVILTGYFSPLATTCEAFSRVTASEVAWAKSQVAALNNLIKDVADDYRFARYAPVNFNGHELCSADPWIQGASDPAPIHPTAEGQEAIARSVITAVQ